MDFGIEGTALFPQQEKRLMDHSDIAILSCVVSFIGFDKTWAADTAAQIQEAMLELTALVAAQIVLMGMLSLNRHSRGYLMGLAC